MKNIIKLFLLLFITSSAAAQNEKVTIVYPPYDYGKSDGKMVAEETTVFKKLPDISFNQYDLEGASYVEVTNCVAGSDVAFYSNKSGGKVVKTATVDKTGKVVFEQPHNFNPAFAVNLKNKNNAGIAGNGMLDFADAKLFSLQDVRLEKNATAQTVISWKAQVNFDNAVIEIQKSTDGNIFKPIGTVDVNKSNSLSTASFTDDKEANAMYRLMLVNKGTGNTYLTKPIQMGIMPGIAKIYPSPTSDNLTVALAPTVQTASYVILDNAGKVIRQGQLTQKTFKVAVSDLTKGIYFIKITSGDNRTETKQFIKN
jgi:hypothetical protein